MKHHFPDNSDALIGRMDDHYGIISKDTAFASSSKNPVDKRLDFTAYFLALIKTLDEQKQSFDVIRIIVLK